MPCTPAVLNLPADEVGAQVGEGGKREAGGTRVGSISISISSSTTTRSTSTSTSSSSSTGSSSSSHSNIDLGGNLITVAAGVELCSLAPNIVGMPRPAGIPVMTQVPRRSGPAGRFPRWVGSLPIDRQERCHRWLRRRRAEAVRLVVHVGAKGVVCDATNRVASSQSARFSQRMRTLRSLPSPPALTAQRHEPMVLIMVRHRTPLHGRTAAAGHRRHLTAVVGIPLQEFPRLSPTRGPWT